jgi:hypothetical protein
MLWEIKDDSTAEMKISDGKYLLKNKIDGVALWTTIDAPHLQSENFKLTASLSKTKGIDNNGFGIVWGAKDMNNDCEFVISSNGFFKVLKWKDGIKEDITDWTYSSAINKWDSVKNELKIDCTEKTTHFYINNTHVFATKYIETSGLKTGFIVNETMNVEIDEFIVENYSVNSIKEVTDSIQNIQISKVELSGNETYNTLKYGEKATLSIELLNSGTAIGTDLVLNISETNNSNSLIFNQIIMVDSIKPGETKQVKTQIESTESALDQNITIKLSLSNIDKKVLVTDNFNFATKKPEINANQNYYNPNDNYDNSFPDSNSNSSNDEFDNCMSTCISAGIITLFSALFDAIFD